MAILRATVKLAPKSGVDVDEAVNVWHFETAGLALEGHLLRAALGLEAFYRHLGDRFAASVSRASQAHRIELAQVTQGGAGEDDDVVTKVLAQRAFDFVGMGGGAASLPSEVAAALSFRGDITGVPEEQNDGLIRPASRRRGRIFIGPLVHAAGDLEPDSNRFKLTPGFRAQVLDAYSVQALPQWNSEPSPVRHIVYSRQSAATHPVTVIHVDDAFDTVRRRGERSVVRESRDVVQAAF